MPNTAGQSGQTYFDSPIFNGPTPPEGAKAMAVNCPFTDENTAFNIDLTLSQTQNYISLIQGVFVDNSANADVVSITSNGATNQKIEFPAGAQGYVPLLATKPTSFTVASAGAVTVPIIFLNVAVPAIIWGEASGGGGGGGGVIQITNPGETPTVDTGASIAAVSDASGNLNVLLNASYNGSDPFTAGGSQFIKSDGQNNLSVSIANAETTFSVDVTDTVTTQAAFPNPVFGQYAVGTTQVNILTADGNQPIFATIYNGGLTSIYIGGYGVSDTTGYEIASKTSFTMPAPTSMPYSGDPSRAGLWAISASGSNNVSIWGSYT